MVIHFAFKLRAIYDSMHMGQLPAFIFWFHLSKYYGVIIWELSFTAPSRVSTALSISDSNDTF